jgi:membrane protein DedA with SNARE-associated domain
VAGARRLAAPALAPRRRPPAPERGDSDAKLSVGRAEAPTVDGAGYGTGQPATSATPPLRLGYPAHDLLAPRAASGRPIYEAFVLSFIDIAVIPFLHDLYAAVGYLGVFFAMVVESTLLPLPSELILPFAGFLVSDHSIEPLTHSQWNFWIVVVVGVVANTTGSLCGYALGAKLGRPFLDRWGRFLLIRPHEVDQAEHFFARWGSPTAFFSRLLPGVRSVISFIAGVSHMPIGRFTVYSTLGAIPWTIALVYAGTVLGNNWTQIRDALRPFDTLILAACVAAVVVFVAWRLIHRGPDRGPAEA